MFGIEQSDPSGPKPPPDHLSYLVDGQGLGLAGTLVAPTSGVPSSHGCSAGSLKLRCVYLEVTLLNGQNYSIPVEEGHSVEEELELFLSRDGRYAGDWVPLQKASRRLFVRYEQIVLVSPMG